MKEYLIETDDLHSLIKPLTDAVVHLVEKLDDDLYSVRFTHRYNILPELCKIEGCDILLFDTLDSNKPDIGQTMTYTVTAEPNSLVDYLTKHKTSNGNFLGNSFSFKVSSETTIKCATSLMENFEAVMVELNHQIPYFSFETPYYEDSPF